jgi:hypothetical protein
MACRIAGALCAAQIVHHNDVALPQRGNQELLDPGLECFRVDRSVKDARGDGAVITQPGHEGERLAMIVWDFGDQPLAFGATAMCARHIGLHPGFVDEGQTGRGDLALPVLPLPSPAGHIGPILLTRIPVFLKAETGMVKEMPNRIVADLQPDLGQFSPQLTAREVRLRGNPLTDPRLLLGKGERLAQSSKACIL